MKYLPLFHLTHFLGIHPFNGRLFLCLPILGETLLVCFCFLNWSALTPCFCGVNFYDRRPVGFSGVVSLIYWTWCSWDALYAIYVGSLVVIGFWLLLGHCLVGPSLQLVDWGSPGLVCYCAGAAQTKSQSLRNKPTPGKITPTRNPTINSINNKWTSINKVVKRLRLLWEKRSKYEMIYWKINNFDRVEGGALIREMQREKVNYTW